MNDASSSGATVQELIRLREQLTAWIGKLDEVGPQASSAVAERVRADYQDRLRRVTEDLGSHGEEIAADLERFREALGDAETRRAAAGEALEEARLRHLIGELDDAAWDEARPELERDVSGADDAVAHARAEVERLQSLSADIQGAAAVEEVEEVEEVEAVWTPEPEVEEAPEAQPETEPTSEPAPESEPEPEPEQAPPAAEAREAADAAPADEWDPFGGEFGTEEKVGDAAEELPWLAGIEDAKGWEPPAAEGEGDSGLEFLRGIDEPAAPAADAAEPAAPDLGADDLAFLEELDRSIGGAGARPPSDAAPQPPQPAPAEGAPAPAASRAEPLLCKECGAINEPHSWYCEICGSEL
jgi:hypothetical protein